MAIFEENFKNAAGESVHVISESIYGEMSFDIISRIGQLYTMAISAGTSYKELRLDLIPKIIKDNLNSKDTLQLIKDIFCNTKLNGKEISKKVNFDMMFSGEDITLLFEILMWVLEKNYKSFLAEGLTKIFTNGILKEYLSVK
jgi:hypothetical protein